MSETFEEKTLHHIENLYVCYDRTLQAEDELRNAADMGRKRDMQLLILAAVALAVAVAALIR